MLIVDEYPARRLLLAKHDDLNFARIERLRPGGALVHESRKH
jgi:hypothetical protein